jgi:hypothetical protein
MINEAVSLVNGEVTFEMQPNAVQLFQFVIPELLGVSDNEGVFPIKVFPNPATNKFELVSDQSIGRFDVLDLAGQIIESYTVNESSTTIDLSNYPNGCYLLQFATGATAKIVKR